MHNNIILDNTQCLEYHFGASDYDEKMSDKFKYKKIKFVCYNSMNESYKNVFDKLMQNVLDS